jgi:hypothetical protein
METALLEQSEAVVQVNDDHANSVHIKNQDPNGPGYQNNPLNVTESNPRVDDVKDVNSKQGG